MTERQQMLIADDEESMINARQASYALRLPYYWFADRKMRAAMRIPHYQFCRLVRFKLSELEVWHQQNAKRMGGAALKPSGCAA